jgi:CheY-like chemotaxis protein
MAYLRAEPYDLVHVETGSEAIEAIVKDPPPDAVLLDLVLPDMSGFEVLEFVSENLFPSSVW